MGWLPDGFPFCWGEDGLKEHQTHIPKTFPGNVNAQFCVYLLFLAFHILFSPPPQGINWRWLWDLTFGDACGRQRHWLIRNQLTNQVATSWRWVDVGGSSISWVRKHGSNWYSKLMQITANDEWEVPVPCVFEGSKMRRVHIGAEILTFTLTFVLTFFAS